MNKDFKLIHQKLDHLASELAAIKANLKIVQSNSPPLSLKQAAAYLHLSVSRIYDLVYSGKLKPLQHRKGGRILFSKKTLDQYLYEHTLP